jgi:hypothetical protein
MAPNQSVNPKDAPRNMFGCQINYDSDSQASEFYRLGKDFLIASAAKLSEPNPAYDPNLCQCIDSVRKAYGECIYSFSNPWIVGLFKNAIEIEDDNPFDDTLGLLCCEERITNQLQLAEHIYVKHNNIRVSSLNL